MTRATASASSNHIVWRFRIGVQATHATIDQTCSLSALPFPVIDCFDFWENIPLRETGRHGRGNATWSSAEFEHAPVRSYRKRRLIAGIHPGGRYCWIGLPVHGSAASGRNCFSYPTTSTPIANKSQQGPSITIRPCPSCSGINTEGLFCRVLGKTGLYFLQAMRLNKISEIFINYFSLITFDLGFLFIYDQIHQQPV